MKCLINKICNWNTTVYEQNIKSKTKLPPSMTVAACEMISDFKQNKTFLCIDIDSTLIFAGIALEYELYKTYPILLLENVCISTFNSIGKVHSYIFTKCLLSYTFLSFTSITKDVIHQSNSSV